MRPCALPRVFLNDSRNHFQVVGLGSGRSHTPDPSVSRLSYRIMVFNQGNSETFADRDRHSGDERSQVKAPCYSSRLDDNNNNLQVPSLCTKQKSTNALSPSSPSRHANLRLYLRNVAPKTPKTKDQRTGDAWRPWFLLRHRPSRLDYSCFRSSCFHFWVLCRCCLAASAAPQRKQPGKGGGQMQRQRAGSQV